MDAKDNQKQAAKEFLQKKRLYRPKDDLCDGELIHLMTLGNRMEYSLKQTPVLCFTCDAPETIERRIRALNGVLEDCNRDIQDWSIRPCRGQLHCISKNGPLKIIHSFFDQESHTTEDVEDAALSLSS